ncbi:MAG: ABC transporter ATP-binding protein [Anaerolineales bacterium]|nr:ABC transporter ATP-binding protein [Anaerolineales bacterium]MDW8447769.1 ABC transporter ATP-binding protein [Anaerolineales bacterium]
MNLAIQTQHLSRTYKLRNAKNSRTKELVALQDVCLEVHPGELFGLLGPNGAGKTTLIKILTTLLAPTSGKALVCGYDVVKEASKIRPIINMVSGGESSGYGLLTVRENLWMFAQFYGLSSKEANRRIAELLKVVGLSDRINTKSSDLSTGLRQKMNIVRGFLTDPQVLFLDEPTLGLDVGAARDVRRFIRNWLNQHPERTILLTTHYMAEAEELCDRVAIINQGRVLACDTPASLKHKLQREAIYHLEVTSSSILYSEHFKEIQGVRKFSFRPRDGYAVLDLILDQDETLAAVVNTLTAHQVRIINLQKREPSLEEVFIDLVGKSIEEVESGRNGSGHSES